MGLRSPRRKNAVILTFQIAGHQSMCGKPSAQSATDLESSIAASKVEHESPGSSHRVHCVVELGMCDGSLLGWTTMPQFLLSIELKRDRNIAHHQNVRGLHNAECSCYC